MPPPARPSPSRPSSGRSAPSPRPSAPASRPPAATWPSSSRPPGLHVPVLYFALMAVSAAVSPANPALTAGELAHLAALSKPSVAFAVSGAAGKLLPGLSAVLIDSPGFLSFLRGPGDASAVEAAVVYQSDPAAVLYSSGTTGSAKAVVLTHRNLMTARVMLAPVRPDEVLMLTVPLFHVYGFVFCLWPVTAAQTLVLHTARRFDTRGVLAAVGRFQVTRLALAPPALLAIVQTAEGDESVTASAATLQVVLCGGAALSPELIRRF